MPGKIVVGQKNVESQNRASVQLWSALAKSRLVGTTTALWIIGSIQSGFAPDKSGLPPHSKSVARSAGLVGFFIPDPEVCSLRSLHPRLYAAVRSAHSHAEQDWGQACHLLFCMARNLDFQESQIAGLPRFRFSLRFEISDLKLAMLL